MKYKNYKNSHTNDNRIYSNKEIADMSVREVFKNKDAIMAQHSQIGIPSEKLRITAWLIAKNIFSGFNQ